TTMAVSGDTVVRAGPGSGPRQSCVSADQAANDRDSLWRLVRLPIGAQKLPRVKTSAWWVGWTVAGAGSQRSAVDVSNGAGGRGCGHAGVGAQGRRDRADPVHRLPRAFAGLHLRPSFGQDRWVDQQLQ